MSKASNFFGNAFLGLSIGGGCFGVIAVIVLMLLLGPICMAYDLNHLLPLITHQTYAYTWSMLPILLIGFILAKVWVPVALVTWALVSLGIIL